MIIYNLTQEGKVSRIIKCVKNTSLFFKKSLISIEAWIHRSHSDLLEQRITMNSNRWIPQTKTSEDTCPAPQKNPNKNKQITCLVNLSLGQFCLFIQIQRNIWRSHVKHWVVNQVKSPTKVEGTASLCQLTKMLQPLLVHHTLSACTQDSTASKVQHIIREWGHLSLRESANQRS